MTNDVRFAGTDSMGGRKLRRLGAIGVLLGLAVALLLSPAPARANCYELIGCTNKDYYKSLQLSQLSCQLLWDVRNSIYKENGYCFHTSKAIKYFGNAGCKYDDAGKVPLNGAERYNILAIRRVEAHKGCS